jgi:hypothetical protein
MLSDTRGETLAIGLFVALDPAGTPWRFDLSQPEQPSWLLGASTSHVVLFAPAAISEDSAWSETLGFSPGPGYQLVELSQSACDDPEADCADGEDTLGTPVPAGNASQVSLVIGPPGQVALPLLEQ